jgi:Ser/Thr protein kinase RdoA (MazF antagonist)
VTGGGPQGEPLALVASRFDIAPPLCLCGPLGRGLINDTFRIDAGGQGYVLQRINARVFPHPEQIMANLLVLRDLLDPGDPGGPRTPRLILARDGASFVRDAEGAVWRMMELIPDAISLAEIQSADEAREVGRVLGAFHRAGAGLPVKRFGISLPGFHATPEYLRRLHQVAGSARRGPEVEALLAFVDARQALAERLDQERRAGRIPTRITHGDPKLDNILFSSDRRRALALIDLDTVQPGLIQHDLGDCLRSCCNRQGEGAADPRGACFDLDLCAEILDGYAAETRGVLSEADVAALYQGIQVMPFELGIRFLTDYLEGNRYFRVEHPEQNLRKAQVQLALAADIERQEAEIRRIIEQAFRGG